MAERLRGKVALISGAAQGAGRGAALAFAREGASLVLVGRTESKLRELQGVLRESGATTHLVAADVGRREEAARCVDQTVAAFGTVDVLVNAAQSPSMRSARLLEISSGVVDELWRTGPVATLELMRACHPHLSGGGSIINFGSGAQFVPGGYGVYAAVKSAIGSMTRAAAVEWGSDGIRANLVVPMVHSPANDEAMSADPSLEQMLIDTIPLGRIGDPELDIGNPLVFLASDEARYVTGTTLMLDGGQQYLR